MPFKLRPRSLRRRVVHMTCALACVFVGSTAGVALASNDDPAPQDALPRNDAHGVDLTSEIVLRALSSLGVRYRRGGETPQAGFDCSGLVKWVYDRTLGIALPRRSEEIAQLGTAVDPHELQPGDLVFFKTLKHAFSHVGIYIGDGRFLHAPRSGEAVRLETLDEPYWQRRWNGARRIDAINAPLPPPDRASP